MDTRARIDAYGGNPHRLTPAQRRRAAHKDRRANQRGDAYCPTGFDGTWHHAAFLDGSDAVRLTRR